MSRTNSRKLAALFSFFVIICLFSPGTTHALTGLSVTGPHAGDVLPAGSTASITWNSPVGPATYNLYLSLNSGTTWTAITNGTALPNLPGSMNYSWTVPVPPKGGNVATAKIKVEARSGSNTIVGAAISASFTIQTLKVTSPNGGETVSPKANPATIGYTMYGPNPAAASATLSFTTNGGTSWSTIGTVPVSAPTQSINPYTYSWTVPAQTALRTACKVKVVIKNISGGTIAADLSNANFTILPFFAISGTATLNAKPLSGVTMSLGGADSGTTVTDINGKYIFKNLLPGNYTVSATKSEYVFKPAATSVTLKAANFTTANFTALGFAGPAYTLSGNVSGATVTGVLLTLTGTTSGTVMTDSSGNYSFAHLPAGFYTVTPSKTSNTFAPLSAALVVNGVTLNVNFTSSATSGATFSISGKATLNGAALPGAMIAMTGPANATVITDGSGNYTIKGLKNGTYNLAASSTGCAFPAGVNKTIAGANLTGVNFAATSGSTFIISGHILSTNSSTIPSATVTLNSVPARTAKTDTNGFYQFTGVPNGTYTLTPSLAGASAAFYPANAMVTMNGSGATRDFGAQIAYTVSGSVGYGGTKHGRIYIGLRDANGGPTRVSTSVGAPGPFSIRGVSPGSYILTARMDNLGWGTKNIVEPNTTQQSALAVTVTSANLANRNIKLFDPDLLSLQTPSTPTGLAVFPGDSTALITWKGDYSINPDRYVEQKELADSYKIYWGTDSAASNGTPITVPAYGQQFYIQAGLNDGVQIYYKISALLKGQESAPSGVVGPVTIGAIETPNSMWGTVTLPAPVPDSKPLYVGVYGENGIYFTSLETLASSQSYTYIIMGIPNGNYQAFAFVDLLQNNLLNVGDMSIGLDGRVKMPVVFSSSDAIRDITVPAANSMTVAASNHRFDGTNDLYALVLGAARQKKLPVKVTLTSGPNVPVPMDVGRTSGGDPGSFGGFVDFGPFRPSAGDAYAFAVTYSDNTTQTLTATVKAVLDSFAQNLSVDPEPSDATPTFNWSPPASPPAPTYLYSIEVDEQNSGQVWNSSNSDAIIPASTTSVQYNFDNSAGLVSLATGSQYNWLITVNDAVGDTATMWAPTYTPGSSIFDITGTVSGAIADGVTVNLTGTATHSTVTGNGGKYSFTNLAPGTYSVVASLATYTFSPSVGQPITITDTDEVVDFTAGLIPRHSVSGKVTFGGIGFPGVTVTAAGTSGSSTTTDANGNYTLSGLVSGFTYTITSSKTNYTFSSPVTQAIGGSDVTGVDFTTLSGSGHDISGTVDVTENFGGGGTLQGVLLTLDTSPATTAVTDGGGNYSFSNIPDGPYTVTPSFAGTNATFYPASRSVTMSNADRINQGFGARVTFTVTGTVSYGGGQTGRVYISMGSGSGLGTSIADINSSPTFTIRGVPPGSYTLNAWMDTSTPETGTQIVSSPTGSISSVNITNTDISGQTVTIADPAPASPGVPTNVYAFPSDSAAFIMWKPPLDNNGSIQADHFKVYYDLISNAITTTSSPHLAPIQATDSHSSIAVISAPTVTNGLAYHFAVTAVLGGTESLLSSAGTATIGATAGQNSISGSVTYPPAADGKKMVAGVFSDTNGVFFTVISNLTGTPASYSVAGIPDGAYTPFAVIDMNNDSALDIGDISNTHHNNNNFVTVSGNSLTTGVDQTLSGANATPLVNTNHNKDRTGNDSYGLQNVSVTGNLKLPVKASLTGPLVLGPTDLDTSANASPLFIDFGPDRPVSGETYSFSVDYSDNTSEPQPLTAQISAVLDSFAQALTVTPVPNDGTPTFSWTAPVSPPANYTNSLMVFQNMGGTIWEYPRSGPFTGTSILYNFDGQANPPSLAGGTTYGWVVTVSDANNNTATTEAPFYTPGSSIFTISGTMSGAVVDGVTMHLTGDLTTDTTTTNGGHYSFPNLSPGSYTITPEKYGYTFLTLATLPVVITDTQPAAVDFTSSAIPTYHISGNVIDDKSLPFAGVLITVTGATTTTAVTNSSGNYDFPGIVNGSYTVTPSLLGYSFSPVNTPVTISDGNSSGNNFTGTPLPAYNISGQVTFNGIGFPGVTVTATGDIGGSTTTNPDGTYTIPSLLSGVTYTITASKTGYTFSSPLSVPNLSGNVTGKNFTTAGGSGYSISGTVFLNQFFVLTNGLPGALLMLNTTPTVTALTDGTGNYTISNIPNGDYTLTPTMPGAQSAFYPASMSVTVSSGPTNSVNFSGNIGYTVSGAVSYPSFTHTGRVYVVLQGSGGVSGNTGTGTSIPWPSIVTSQTFTIHGVPPGNYSLAAWMDTSSPETGAVNGAAPISSSSANVDVTNANVISPDIVISDPTTTLPPPAPTNVQVYHGAGTALVQWKASTDSNGFPLADHYTVYYVTPTTNPINLSSPHVTFQATGDEGGHVFVAGLTNTSTYKFAVTATLKGSESAFSTTANATIGATTGANSVSGSITFPATDATGNSTTGKKMYVLIYNKTSGIFFTPVTVPSSSPASYTIAGVPGGTYTPLAVIDMNGNGAIDAGDLSNNGNSNANNFVVVSGTTTGANQTLSGANALASLSTVHSKLSNGSESYTLDNIYVGSNAKLAVKATITGTNSTYANLPVPIDLYGGSLMVPVGTALPKFGDSYTVHVDYSDGTNEDLPMTVTGVLDQAGNFASGLTVDTSTGATTPIFSWTAPVSPPANLTYSIFVSQLLGNMVWAYPQDGVLRATSVQYNADGNANPPSLTTGSYDWYISVIDSYNNKAAIQAPAPYIVP